MTDNEIIKALEYCQSETTENCNKCPLVFKGACQQECLRKAFDLINRQQAEIEKQRIMLEAIEDAVNPLPFETDYDKSIKQAKSEAIKEFAERLKAKSSCCVASQNGQELYETKSYTIKAIEIDNLVKEMVGDNNAE